MDYKKMIKEMTLVEKASLMSGENFWNTKTVDRLNIPAIMMTDGPHGLRKQGGKADHLGLNSSLPATCFPTAATLANSWDKELIHEVGEYLGAEARHEKVSILLGPGLNIKRNPLCGRNFEYFSEDPYLSGTMATEMVKGIQSQGVAACPKHFAVNSQEHMRMTIDEIVDERALREIYLRGFEQAIKESQPKTIMTSYNRVNGTYANEHPHLMNDILYGEWGFDGVAITDWGGNNDRIAGLKAGNQLEMPSSNGITDREIVTAVENNELDEAILDEAVERMLKLVFSTQPDSAEFKVDYDKQHAKAAEAAKRSIVLLKNDKQALPLNKTQKVALIGDFAQKARYQGAGSSLINPTKEPNAVEVFKHDKDINVVGFAPGFKRMGQANQRLIDEAVVLAKEVDKVLLFLGLDESIEAEGVDRKSLALPTNQLELLDAILAVNPKVVVILSGGGAIELPFANRVQGIVHTYLAGQGGVEGLAEVLSGRYNPSAKLSETFPLHCEDVSSAPFYPGEEATAEHRESIFIGYRYFDKVNVPVLYPFGYGLSYTRFEYSALKREGMTISFTIRNVGAMAGEEVAQLYVQKENSEIFRAKRELRHFAKVFLKPGESQEIRFTLSDKDFYYYSVKQADWAIEAGEYTIQIGASLTDIRLDTTVEMTGVNEVSEYTQEEYPTYFSGQVHDVSAEEFEALLGYTPPSPTWNPATPLGMNDTIAQAKHKNWLGKGTHGTVILAKDILSKINNPIWSNNMYFVLNMPYRQIARFTGGKISEKNVRRYLKFINGKQTK